MFFFVSIMRATSSKEISRVFQDGAAFRSCPWPLSLATLVSLVFFFFLLILSKRRAMRSMERKKVSACGEEEKNGNQTSVVSDATIQPTAEVEGWRSLPTRHIFAVCAHKFDASLDRCDIRAFGIGFIRKESIISCTQKLALLHRKLFDERQFQSLLVIRVIFIILEFPLHRVWSAAQGLPLLPSRVMGGHTSVFGANNAEKERNKKKQ